MSKSKIVGIIALIAFATGILLVGDALAAERGKFVARWVVYTTAVHTLKVPDAEGHTILLSEAKGIAFTEKWGACLAYQTGTLDLLKGEGTGQGYAHYTFPDGSTFTNKWEGKSGGSIWEGTWTCIKGTGKFEGIQGAGTFKSHGMGPDRTYSDVEGEYTLP
jgi:hypothetical protein